MKNKDKINWMMLSTNTSIFTYDYQRIEEKRDGINEDFVAYVHRPEFISAYLQHDEEADVADEEEYVDWFDAHHVSALHVIVESRKNNIA